MKVYVFFAMTIPNPNFTLPCPAKLNLFLEVRGKRQDGFHELGTLFQALDIGDTLSAEPWMVIDVVDDMNQSIPLQENLIYKAAALLRTCYANQVKQKGIRFHLNKKLPMGAGLGGGSSDAATALLLANRVWNLNLSSGELQLLAPMLGSDVAFFLQGPTTFAEGRGEKLTHAPSPYPFHVVVATPHCHVETAWAYQQVKSPYGNEWPNFKANYTQESANPLFYRDLTNDFERFVVEKKPEISEIREALASFQPVKVMLTGSGSSLFALFLDESTAFECQAAISSQCRFSAVSHFLKPKNIF